MTRHRDVVPLGGVLTTGDVRHNRGGQHLNEIPSSKARGPRTDVLQTRRIAAGSDGAGTGGAKQRIAETAMRRCAVDEVTG
jgi:hypothetical protein